MIPRIGLEIRPGVVQMKTEYGPMYFITCGTSNCRKEIVAFFDTGNPRACDECGPIRERMLQNRSKRLLYRLRKMLAVPTHA